MFAVVVVIKKNLRLRLVFESEIYKEKMGGLGSRIGSNFSFLAHEKLRSSTAIFSQGSGTVAPLYNKSRNELST